MHIWRARQTKFQVGELMNIIGISYSNMTEALVTGAEITQSQLYNQSPPNNGCQIT